MAEQLRHVGRTGARGAAGRRRLRTPALDEDWAAWSEAWHALDAGPIAALLDADDTATLTLAGERRALPFTRTSTSTWQRLRAAWRRTAAHQVLDGL